MARVAALAFCLLCSPVRASGPRAPALDGGQSEAFRSWFVRIVLEQFRQGPSPRWVHRDCAGLVRFAAYEALKDHDHAWRKAGGMEGPFPPEVQVREDQKRLLNRWRLPGAKGGAGGEEGPFASAIALIQENSGFVSKDINEARAGDLLFFDQGEDQHLMVWTGPRIAYHKGRTEGEDTGLRSVTPSELMVWKDTRWHPSVENPNFIGVYRFSFLSR